MPYHIYVWSFTSSRVFASLNVTCVFFSTITHPRLLLILYFKPRPRTPQRYLRLRRVLSNVHPRVSPPLHFPLDPRTSSLCLLLVFLVTLIFYVALRVILLHILMLTPFQRTSTLLVQCIPTPHKPLVRMAPLIKSRCSAILSLVLKLHTLSLKTPVTFHLLFNQ